MATLQLDAGTVAALRIAAQGLPAPRDAGVSDQIATSGYQRTLGGADAYIAVRARVPKLVRADLEALIQEGELVVIPAVRGCIYVVPASEAPMCLSIAGKLTERRDERDAEKAGIREGELDEVSDAVHEELRAGGPRTTAGLRKALGTDLIRSLGDRGKKVGVSSTLPPALRRLEFSGRISRVPVDGRLDHEKYEWRAAEGDPLGRAELPEEPARLHALLLRGFVQRAGVTNLDAFCAWSGLTKRDAKAALTAAGDEVQIVEAVGIDGDALAPQDLAALQKRAKKSNDATAFLPFEDNLIHLHGAVANWIAPEHHDLEVPAWSNMRDAKDTTRLGDARHVRWRSILCEGRIRGFWDYDPVEQVVVTGMFDPPSKTGRQRVETLAGELTAFLRDEIGHGLSFSIDTDESLTRRCQLLRDLIG